MTPVEFELLIDTPNGWTKIEGLKPGSIEITYEPLSVNTPGQYGRMAATIGQPVHHAKTPAELLDKAIEILQKDGWYQGALVDYAGAVTSGEASRMAPVCALGALNRASSGMAEHCLPQDAQAYNDAAEALMSVIADAEGFRGSYPENPIPEFNDAVGRSVEDVLLAFKHARAMFHEET